MLARFLLVPVTISFFLSFSSSVSAMMADEFVVRGGYAFLRPRLVNWFGVSSVCICSQRFSSTTSSKGKFILPQIPQHLLEKNQTVKPSKRISLRGPRHYNATDDLFYYDLDRSQKEKTKPVDQAKFRVAAAVQQKKT